MRFIGTIEAKVDSKGRVFLPAAFRRVMQDAVATVPYSLPTGEASDPTAEGAPSPSQHTDGGKGETRLIMRKDVFEDCLVIYTEDVWYARLDELQSRLSIWNRQEQAMLRKFVTDAEWLSLDNNGRFLIPKRYLKMAGIEGAVTFVGMDGTIEIWATDRLQSQQSDADFANNVEALMSTPK